MRCILKCTGTKDNPVIKTYSRYGKLIKTLEVVTNYVMDYVIRAINLMGGDNLIHKNEIMAI